jgi:hypothetical protein
MHGEVGYLVFRHRQTNANPRSRGKWRQNACVCVCILTFQRSMMCTAKERFKVKSFAPSFPTACLSSRFTHKHYLFILRTQPFKSCSYQCIVLHGNDPLGMFKMKRLSITYKHYSIVGNKSFPHNQFYIVNLITESIHYQRSKTQNAEVSAPITKRLKFIQGSNS